MKEKPYSLVEFSKDEGTELLSELQVVLDKYQAVYSASPIIEDGKIGTTLTILKKVELVPKDVPSTFFPPIDKGGETTPA